MKLDMISLCVPPMNFILKAVQNWILHVDGKRVIFINHFIKAGIALIAETFVTEHEA